MWIGSDFVSTFINIPAFKLKQEDLTADNISYSNPEKPDVENVAQALQDMYTGKVDKVPGKGLSTNDYTDGDKHKVDTLAGQLFFASYQEFPNIGQEGILYIATDKNTSYIWNNTEMVYMSMTIDDTDTSYTIQGIL